MNALIKRGKELPEEGTKLVFLYQKVSPVNDHLKTEVFKYSTEDPVKYYVIILKYEGHDLWIIQNKSYSLEGKPIIRPPEFDNLDDAIACADKTLEEYEIEN